MSIHVMLDLETFDTGNNALPVSIGAVKFDAEKIVDRLHVGIDPVDTQLRFPSLRIGADCMLWWFAAERDEARKQWLELGKVDLFAALDGFAMWCGQTPANEQGSLWGNGSTFDNVVLRNAYKAAKLEFPFSFRKDACYRTLKNLAPKDVEFERIGTHHNAVDDAESQAVHLQKICAALGIEL